MQEPLLCNMYHNFPMCGPNAALYALVLYAISRPKSTLATRFDEDSIQGGPRDCPIDL